VNGTCFSTFVAAATVCGNGTLEQREECDDGNRRDGDGCTEQCLLEIGVCGDGKVQSLLGEQCESSIHDPTLPFGCVRCRFVSVSCGDGVIDPGEECDDGQRNSASPDARCRPDCSFSRCGDGILDTNEMCDDGNLLEGDACDRSCRTGRSSAVLFDNSQSNATAVAVMPQAPSISNVRAGNMLNIVFPTFPGQQPLPMQLPYAQLQPIIAQAPRTPQSGPAAVAALGAGAAAGFSWVRRRRK